MDKETGTCFVRLRHARFGADEAVHDRPRDDHVTRHGEGQPRDEVCSVSVDSQDKQAERTYRRRSDGSRAQS